MAACIQFRLEILKTQVKPYPQMLESKKKAFWTVLAQQQTFQQHHPYTSWFFRYLSLPLECLSCHCLTKYYVNHASFKHHKNSKSLSILPENRQNNRFVMWHSLECNLSSWVVEGLHINSPQLPKNILEFFFDKYQNPQ